MKNNNLVIHILLIKIYNWKIRNQLKLHGKLNVSYILVQCYFLLANMTVSIVEGKLLHVVVVFVHSTWKVWESQFTNKTKQYLTDSNANKLKHHKHIIATYPYLSFLERERTKKKDASSISMQQYVVYVNAANNSSKKHQQCSKSPWDLHIFLSL